MVGCPAPGHESRALGQLRCNLIDPLLEGDVNETCDITRQLDGGLVKNGNATASKAGEHHSKLQYDILPSSTLPIFLMPREMPHVIRSEQNTSEANVVGLPE